MYDFEGNHDYLNYFIRLLQLEILANKGLSDYNAGELYEKVTQL